MLEANDEGLEQWDASVSDALESSQYGGSVCLPRYIFGS